MLENNELARYIKHQTRFAGNIPIHSVLQAAACLVIVNCYCWLRFQSCCYFCTSTDDGNVIVDDVDVCFFFFFASASVCLKKQINQ